MVIKSRTDNRLENRIIQNIFYMIDLFLESLNYHCRTSCFSQARDKTLRERPLFSIRPLPGFSQGPPC